MPRLIDISPLLSERLRVWPGDVPFERPVGRRHEDGTGCALSSIRTTLHVGAHADAPGHTRPDGRAIHELPLEIFHGPCQVLEVDVRRGARIRPSDLRTPVRAPRVLFRTGTFPDPEAFTTDFAAFSVELADALAAAGVVLAGIDTPSVDLFDDPDLAAHRALARHGIVNVEGLVLENAPAGLYTLAAFPLRLEGADASPVRAVLVAG